MSAPALVRARDWTLLVVCNLIWASQFVLAKMVQQEMGPVFATFFPMAVATVLLFPLVLYARARQVSRTPITRAAVLHFVLLGVLGQVVAQLGVTYGVRLAPASNAALLSLTLPIVTALFAFLLLRERMTTIRWLSFALAIGGVLQCSGVDWQSLRVAGGDLLRGNLLIIAGISGSAFYNVYGKKSLEQYSPVEVLFYSYLVVFVILLPLALCTEPDSIRALSHFSGSVWIGLLLLAVSQYFLSMVLFLSVLSRLDATQAGLSNYLIPFFGLIIAAMVLGERLTVRMVVGGSIVLASTLLITLYEERYQRRNRTQPTEA